MKTQTVILFASLAVFATSASAAQNQNQPVELVLPTYVVNVPRYQAAELKVNASLDEFRQKAQAPVRVAAELPMRREPAAMAKGADHHRVLHVAKI